MGTAGSAGTSCGGGLGAGVPMAIAGGATAARPSGIDAPLPISARPAATLASIAIVEV